MDIDPERLKEFLKALAPLVAAAMLPAEIFEYKSIKYQDPKFEDWLKENLSQRQYSQYCAEIVTERICGEKNFFSINLQYELLAKKKR